jgi:hypothetical protein
MTNETLWGTHVSSRLYTRRENVRTTERGIHNDVPSGEVTAYPSSDSVPRKESKEESIIPALYGIPGFWKYGSLD